MAIEQTTEHAELYDLELFKAARRIADIFFDYVNAIQENRPYREDTRCSEPNPLIYQVRGLFLELNHGVPTYLWTPWGRWNFSGISKSEFRDRDLWKELVNIMVEDLEAKLIRIESLVNTTEGLEKFLPELKPCHQVINPVYAICKVDGIELPGSALLYKDSYAGYDEVLEAWNTMVKQIV